MGTWDLMGTDWSNTKDGTLKKKKSYREPDCFYALDREWGWGRWHREKCAEQNFRGFFLGLFKVYYVLDTVNHLYSHIQEVNLQNFMRG